MKKTTRMRKPISPEEKLAVTLSFLATGESYESLMCQFRIHRTTIAAFIPKVCLKLYMLLKYEYLSTPRSKDKWETLARYSANRWRVMASTYLLSTRVTVAQNSTIIKDSLV